MNRRLLDILVCPLDGTPLELRAWEVNERQLDSSEAARAERFGIDPSTLSPETVTGVLVNPSAKRLYPIHGGVSRMLTFSTGVAKEFQNRHSSRLRDEFAGYSFPDEPSMPGERDVLRSFSNEWVNYDWDAQSYWNLTPAAWFRCMRFVLQLDRFSVAGKRVLEVGIGIGGVANYVASNEEGEVVGVDLGYAVDAAYKHFGQNPFLNIVQASAFALPFADRTFDFVYSFGVIHHTFSTKTAFDSISRLPNDRGRLYVWVYSPFDESRTFKRRALMAMEGILRPMIWRLPDRMQNVALAPLVPLYIAHQWMRSLRHPEGAVRYGVREALHAARDRFTPRYIHRHTEEEVCEWFRSAGYGALAPGSELDRPSFVPEAFTASTGVSGIRSDDHRQSEALSGAKLIANSNRR
ncbi:MAG TPA: methyltransferase domain-containing protein [Pirellulales bacterium]|nr:methyltransferase domain-containing protein [Pirellulales bacterium]